MNVVTWNLQGITQKADIIKEDLQKLSLDLIDRTKTNKKGTGTTSIGEMNK